LSFHAPTSAIVSKMREQPEDFFSPDYATARARFCEAAHGAGASLQALELDARGPRGEALATDIAWLGAERPERVFMQTTGLHGVEAYTGSAVQLALLRSPPAQGPRDALVLAHVLNPYGMAWLRRTNENNVDLNRNFLVRGEAWSGAPPLYAALDPFLNPPSPPAPDAFALRALGIVLRHGLRRPLQAIAEGQYEFPRGLFYGGRALEAGPCRFIEWAQQRLAGVAHLLAFDLHTGLGRWGGDLVVPERGVGVTPVSELARAVGRRAQEFERPATGYTVRGLMGAALPHLLPASRVDFLLQEIGTYRMLTVLHALREENRWHFHGDGSIAHPAKRRLFDVLCPASVEWRRNAVALGLGVAQKAARWVFREV
jgi:hypothetical protein